MILCHGEMVNDPVAATAALDASTILTATLDDAGISWNILRPAIVIELQLAIFAPP
jgi:hypothetical protein